MRRVSGSSVGGPHSTERFFWKTTPDYRLNKLYLRVEIYLGEGKVFGGVARKAHHQKFTPDLSDPDVSHFVEIPFFPKVHLPHFYFLTSQIPVSCWILVLTLEPRKEFHSSGGPPP